MIKYGMRIVGNNLGYIRREDIEGLKDKIYEKILRKFNFDVKINEEDKGSLRVILEGAAESLSESIIFKWRWKDAVNLFNHIGLTEKAQEIEKNYNEYCRAQLEMLAEQQDNHLLFY